MMELTKYINTERNRERKKGKSTRKKYYFVYIY